MYSSRFLRRLLLPSASSAFVVYAANGEEPQDGDGDKPKSCEKLMKACDLPLYSEYKPPEEEESSADDDKINDNSLLITTVRCMREELWCLRQQLQSIKEDLSGVYLNLKGHTEEAVEYLRDKDNFYPRVGAITAGALTGYVFAIRKGRFKKVIYMGVGAGAVSAVVYPQESQYYADETLKLIKKYVIIAYHFLKGVSRDLTGWELPNLPNGHHLVVNDGHHRDSGDSVPEPSHLLPPTVTPIHLHPEEVKKQTKS